MFEPKRLRLMLACFSTAAIVLLSASATHANAQTVQPAASKASTSKWPNAANTGVPKGTVLRASRDITVTQNNAVISGLDISGTVLIKASNVTIKNSKIHGSSDFGVRVMSGNVTILDSELYGFSNAAIVFDNWKAVRVNIHNMGSDGVKLGSNTLLQDSYLHDFTPLAGAHADGGQLQSGEKNIVVRHNSISLGKGTNAALFLAPDLGPSASGPIVIDSNLFGGGNYTLYIVDGSDGKFHQAGYSVTNNRFLRNAQYGVIDTNEPTSSFTKWSGNAYVDNGAVVNR